MADVYELEAMDAVRMTWNIWPNSKAEAAKCQVPFAAFYSPFKDLPNMMVCPYEPVRCKTCTSALNPYARVDFMSRMWVCPLCMSRNQFPSHYAGISEQNLPGELFPQYCTIEYQLPRQAMAPPPCYVFVVDTCVAEDEIEAARSAIQQALSLVPEQSLVGLVTYGRHVQVHELGGGESVSRSYILQGRKPHTLAQIRDQLGLSPARNTGAEAGRGTGGSKFVAPLAECEFAISGVLDSLGTDPWPPVAENRPMRATGNALQVACAVAGSVPPGSESRLMLLVGGPTTSGSGAIVGTPLEEPIRSHKDLKAGGKKAPFVRAAAQFYEGLSEEIAQAGQTCDVFICSLEQVGLMEMKPCAEKTGGILVQTDTFGNPMFRETFKRVFSSRAGEDSGDDDAPPIRFATSALLEVQASRDIKVMGLLGPGAKGQRRGGVATPASDVGIGVGGTNTWRISSMTQSTTPCVVFEVSGEYRSRDEMAAAASATQQFFLQFSTTYTLPNGEQRLRVTTITRKWSDGASIGELIGGFDQEAAAVAMARLVSWRMETEEEFDATRFLDRTLISLCQRFGDFRKDDPDSFNLAPQLSLYPQFMFNLRR